MDIFASGPIAGILDVVYQFVTFLSQILAPVAGASSAAVAVVVLTMVVRALLIPVGASQVRAEFTRRRLAPRLAELQRIHGRDRETLQRKTMELYAQEKASPFAGCLPLLLQAPVLSLVYALFLHPTINGHVNALLSQHLFGVPLGMSFVHAVGTGGATIGMIAVFVGFLAAIATVTAISRTVLTLRPVQTGSPTTPNMVTRVVSYLPFITVVFAAFVPLAAVLYLLTTTSWTVVERTTLRRTLSPDARPPRLSTAE
jgi:YidC/Oxa1 family membrane protein insertase